MDCRSAIELLEVARPDSEDLDDRELASAAAHLEECPQCADQFRKSQVFDRKVGQVLRDVTIPPGLKEKLLKELQAGSFSAEQPSRLERPEPHSTGSRPFCRTCGRDCRGDVPDSSGVADHFE